MVLCWFLREGSLFFPLLLLPSGILGWRSLFHGVMTLGKGDGTGTASVTGSRSSRFGVGKPRPREGRGSLTTPRSFDDDPTLHEARTERNRQLSI